MSDQQTHLVSDEDFLRALGELDGLDLGDVGDLAEPVDPVEPETIEATDDTDDPDDLADDAVADDDADSTPSTEDTDPALAAEGEGRESPPGPSPSLDLGVIWADAFGAEPTPESVTEAISLVQSLNNLTPEQRDALYRTLYGQDIGQPAPAQPTAPPAPTAPAQPAAPATQQPVIDPSTLQYVDPEVRAVIEAQQAQLAQLQEQVAQATQLTAAQQAQIAQRQFAEEQQRLQAGVAAAERKWRANNPDISETDWTRLRVRAVQNTAYPQFLAANGGDHEAATYALFDATLASIPDLSQRLNEMKVQRAVDRALSDQTRKAKSTSLSGGSSAAPRKTTESKADRDRALLEELRQLG